MADAFVSAAGSTPKEASLADVDDNSRARAGTPQANPQPGTIVNRNIIGEQSTATSISKSLNGPKSPAESLGTLMEGTHRVNINTFMNKFQQRLGGRWDEYRETITKFVMGKLSREELTTSVKKNLKPREIKLHNFLFLSILANCCRELPPGDDTILSGWKQTKSQTKKLADTPTELLHREILTLSTKERKRIKNIVKEAAKKPPVPVPPPIVVATRRAMLPKLPYQPDKSGKSAGTARSGGITKPKSSTESTFSEDNEHVESSAPILESQHHHAGKYSNSMLWTQDIVHGFDAPLASESFEIPNDANIGVRMLSLALEHGVLRGIDAGTTDVMIRGLETYLITLITQMYDAARQKNARLDRPLNVFDLDSYFECHPAEFIELSAPLIRMRTTMLVDEESVCSESEVMVKEILPDDLDGIHLAANTSDSSSSLDPAQVEAEIAEIVACKDSYLELVSSDYRPRKRTAAEIEALEISEKGQSLILELLAS